MRGRILIALVGVLATVFVAPTATAAPAESRPIHVVGLRYATHPDFDRVVIDLRGAKPQWSDGRGNRFSYEFSGKPVPIRAPAGVWINIVASGHTVSGDNLYTGPRIARPGFRTLKALALTGDWEGQVTFVFALRHRADYTVRFLPSPSRLVIDFRHR